MKNGIAVKVAVLRILLLVAVKTIVQMGISFERRGLASLRTSLLGLPL